MLESHFNGNLMVVARHRNCMHCLLAAILLKLTHLHRRNIASVQLKSVYDDCQEIPETSIYWKSVKAVYINYCTNELDKKVEMREFEFQ